MRALRLGGPVLVAAISVTVASCPEPHSYPDKLIVTYSFTATPAPGGVDQCLDAGYTEIPLPDASFTFSAIFSGDEDGTIRWMTIQEFVRDAGFDGRIIDSSHSAPRLFGLCGDAGVDETFLVAPLSLTQSQALGGVCPRNPLQPGAIPVNPDAGIFPPGWLVDHFESVRGCGVLTDTIHPAGDKDCPVCTMTFDVSGIRL